MEKMDLDEAIKQVNLKLVSQPRWMVREWLTFNGFSPLEAKDILDHNETHLLSELR